LSFFFSFFFQAEDGIRDRNVTGVQTCALPISSTRSPTWSGLCGIHIFCEHQFIIYFVFCVSSEASTLLNSAKISMSAQKISRPRSEERRVGKDSRYQMAHDNRNKRTK